MNEQNLNKLVGIPFKLNRKDFNGCDCRGIVWLYYSFIKNRILPFSDGKKIFFRNPKNDKDRMMNILKTFTTPIRINDLQKSDIVIINNNTTVGSLGVCINDKQILHMDRIIGSCLTRIRYLKEFILSGYRIND